MKVAFDKKINYFDIGSNFRLRISSLARFLQEAAELHSDKVGSNVKDLNQSGAAWILNKLEIDVRRYPDYAETIRVVTWHRGIKRFKAFRDFEVFSGSNRLAAGSSVWFYFDIQTQKLKRVPPETDRIYCCVEESVLEQDLDKWTADLEFAPQEELALTTRLSDYDPNDHVTNTAYIDYLETLIGVHGYTRSSEIKNLKIQFYKEIGRANRSVFVGLRGLDTFYRFKLFNDDSTFAGGQVVVANQEPETVST